MHILAELTPLKTSDGTRPMLRVCSAADRDLSGYNAQQWWPAISKPPSIQTTLFDGDFSEPTDFGAGDMELRLDVLAAADASAAGYVWAGAGVKIMAWDAGTVTTVVVGKVTRFSSRDNVLNVSFGIDSEPFAFDVLSQSYAGTTGLEGGADIKGRAKPWLFGNAMNVEPVLINAVDNVYQVSAYGPIKAVTAVYERGSQFSASVGDFASYAALVAATIVEGRWGSCLAQGLIRLGAQQFGVITADVEGDFNGSVFRRKSGEIMTRILTAAGVAGGLIVSTSLSALDTDVARNVNLYLTDQVQFLDLAQRMAAPCNAVAGVDGQGRFFVSRVAFGSSVLTIDAQGRQMPPVMTVSEAPVSPPYKRIMLGAARAWRVHDFDEIATAYPLVERGTYVAGTVYREGNIVTLANGSRWLFINVLPQAGVTPGTNGAVWEQLTSPIDATSIGAATTAEVEAALALARARGKLTVGGPVPSVALSNIGDTHVSDDGTFHDRVNDGGITLGGFAITLAGFRPRQSWTPSVVQPLRETIALADEAYIIANDAIDQLIGLADDGILSINEKITKLIPENDRIEVKWQALESAAYAISVSTTAAESARAAWLAFLAGLSPAWNNTGFETPVSRVAYDNVRNAYDNALYQLDRDIKNAARSLAESATTIATAAFNDAAAAQSAANAAQASANAALADLTNIASDSVLTPDEKPRVIIDRDVIVNEQTGIDASATSFAVTTEKTAYDNAITALTSYLATLTSPVLWSNLSGNTTIVGNTFRSKFSDVYATRQTLLNAIAAAAKVRADNAQSSANTALATLADIASDSLLTPDEKPRVIREYQVIIDEQAGIDASATNFGITTEKTAYDTAVTALTTYLATLTTPVLWSTIGGNTAIVGVTFKQKFIDVDLARQSLLNKIDTEAARKTAVMTLAAGRIIYADYPGVAKPGQLPITLVNSRQRGDTSVDAASTWSATFPPTLAATINTTASDTTRGDITVTAMSGAGGEIVVTSVHDGVTLTGSINVIRQKDQPPPPPPSSGATSAQSDASQTTAIATYPASGLVIGPVAAGAAGQIKLEAYLDFSVRSVGGGGASGKWGYATASGGPFTDIPAGEVASTTNTARVFNYFAMGSLDINQTLSGLVNGTDYWFEFRVRKASDASGTDFDFIGNKKATRL